MYIPTWLIIIVAIVIFIIWKSKKKFERPANVEDIERNVQFLKERIFERVHFDSPHFIDYQDAFDAMEINYLRLKQRFSHTPEKVLEIAEDWRKYVESLGDSKHARVMLDVDLEDSAWDRAGERMKEPFIIREEIEKKFKSLLGKDWQNIPPDYSKRFESVAKKSGKDASSIHLRMIGDNWKKLYLDSENLFKLEEKRGKEQEKESNK